VQDRFSAPSRAILATQLEIGIQAGHARKGVIWVFHTLVKVVKGTIRVLALSLNCPFFVDENCVIL
jgi:hypothetical protein